MTCCAAVQVAPITLEGHAEVGAAGRVPELDVFVRPPGDALLHQRNRSLVATGIQVVQLQGVCGG